MGKISITGCQNQKWLQGLQTHLIQEHNCTQIQECSWHRNDHFSIWDKKLIFATWSPLVCYNCNTNSVSHYTKDCNYHNTKLEKNKKITFKSPNYKKIQLASLTLWQILNLSSGMGWIQIFLDLGSSNNSSAGFPIWWFRYHHYFSYKSVREKWPKMKKNWWFCRRASFL